MPRSFLVKKALPTATGSESSWVENRQSEVTSTQCEPAASQTTIWSYDASNGNVDAMTSRVTAAEAADGDVNHSIASDTDHVTSRWLLVSKRPYLCYWLENNIANLPVADDVRTTTGKDDIAVFYVRNRAEQQSQQQRRPLSTLHGPSAPPTVPTSTARHPRNVGTAAAPWRPFTVHEDEEAPAKPSASTTNSGGLCRSTLSEVDSSVDKVDSTVQQLQSSVTTAVQAPFHEHRLLPDAIYSHLMNTLHAHHRKPDIEFSLLFADVFATSYSGRTPYSGGGRALYERSAGASQRQSSSSCPSQPSPSPRSASTGNGSPASATRSPSPLLSCAHCDKTYTSSGALKMHVRTHTLPCRCPSCGKAFSRPWLLQGHIRTHTGERPFTCTVCGRAFADRSNLRAHGQTHAAAKRYQCTGCRRSFSRLSLLSRHERHSTSGCCLARQPDLELDSTRPNDVR